MWKDKIVLYNKNLKKNSANLRHAGNLSEALLWLQIKNKKLNGLDFDRQKIIGNYIVDFYCKTAKLIIEIDGQSHNFKGNYDKVREEYLASLGLQIVHISDTDIKRDMENVLCLLQTHPAICDSTPPQRGI